MGIETAETQTIYKEIEAQGFQLLSGDKIFTLPGDVFQSIPDQVSKMILPKTLEGGNPEPVMIYQSAEQIKLAIEERRATVVMNKEKVVGFAKYKVHALPGEEPVLEVGSLISNAKGLSSALIWEGITLARSAELYNGCNICSVVGVHNAASIFVYEHLADKGIEGVGVFDTKPAGLEFLLTTSEKIVFNLTNAVLKTAN